MKLIQGILPAAVTPLDEDGKFAPAVFERLLERLHGAGVHGVYVCGTTGEGMLQPPGQRQSVVERAAASAPATTSWPSGSSRSTRPGRPDDGRKLSGRSGVSMRSSASRWDTRCSRR